MNTERRRVSVSAAAMAVALILSACSATRVPDPNAPPLTPEQQEQVDQIQRQKDCNWGRLAASGAVTTIAVVVKSKSTKEKLRPLARGVHTAAEAYCEAVVDGRDPDGELIAQQVLIDAINQFNDIANAEDVSLEMMPTPAEMMLAGMPSAAAGRLVQVAPSPRDDEPQEPGAPPALALARQ
jgi:hypothetical protein